MGARSGVEPVGGVHSGGVAPSHLEVVKQLIKAAGFIHVSLVHSLDLRLNSQLWYMRALCTVGRTLCGQRRNRRVQAAHLTVGESVDAPPSIRHNTFSLN